MAKIPNYDASVAIQPQNAVSEAEGFDSLNRMFSGVTQTVENDLQRKRIIQAKQEGAIAGEDPNFKPAINFGAASEAFNEAAEQSQKYTLGADALIQTNKLYQESITNINDQTPEMFKKKFDALTQGILQNTSDANLPYMKNVLIHQYINASNKIQSQLLENQRNNASFILDKNLITYANQASNMAREGNLNSALSLLGQHKRMLANAVNERLLTPREAATYATSAQSDVTEQYVIGSYEQALNSGKSSEFIKDFRNSKQYDSVLSASDKDVIVNKLEALGRQRLQEQGINAQEINQIKKDVLFKLENGGKADPQQLNNIQAYEPNSYPEFLKEMHYSQVQGEIRQRYKYDTVQNMDSAINQLRQPVTKEEVNNDEGLNAYNARIKAANSLEEDKKNFFDDPAGYTEQDPLYQKALDNFNKNGTGNLPQEMIKIQKQRGLEESKISVIPNSVAAQMVGKINAMPYQNQVGALQSIQQIYGPASYYAMRDLAKHGLPIASQILLNMPNDTQGAALYPVAVQALSTDTKILEDNLPASIKKSKVMGDVKTALGTYLNTISGYNGVPQSFANDVTNQVYKVALLKSSQGDTNAAQNAANAMINNHYVFDSFNGYNYRIPIQYSNNQRQINEAIGTAISSLSDKKLKVPNYYKQNLYGIPDDKIQNEYKRLLQPHFITSPNEDSLIMVDSSGAPITTDDNKQINILFDNPQIFIKNNRNKYKEMILKKSMFLPVEAAFQGRNN